MTGEQVTLVDGDLRRPNVAESFGLVEGAGLTDVLVGRVERRGRRAVPPRLPQPARSWPPAATPPEPERAARARRRCATCCDSLAEETIVIVDAPPLLPVTDAAVLTAVADGAFVVISSGKTLDSELGAALGALEAVRGKALGVIFNRVARAGLPVGLLRRLLPVDRPRRDDQGAHRLLSHPVGVEDQGHRPVVDQLDLHVGSEAGRATPSRPSASSAAQTCS